MRRVLTALAVAMAARQLGFVITLLVVSVFLALTLNPLVEQLMLHGLRRGGGERTGEPEFIEQGGEGRGARGRGVGDEVDRAVAAARTAAERVRSSQVPGRG